MPFLFNEGNSEEKSDKVARRFLREVATRICDRIKYQPSEKRLGSFGSDEARTSFYRDGLQKAVAFYTSALGTRWLLQLLRLRVVTATKEKARRKK